MSRRSIAVQSFLVLALNGIAAADDPPDLYDVDVLRNLQLTFYQPDWWNQLVNSYGTDLYVEADMEVDGVLYPRVGVRLRGQLAYYTRSQYKKPFKIKTDAFVAGQKLLGYDTLRLNNASEDPTFCREVVMANLLAESQPMPRYNFIHMTINGGNWGIYINEQTKDQKWAGQWYRDDSGNRYKFAGGNLNYLGPDPGPYQSKYDLRNEDTSVDPWTDLIHLCDVLNNTPPGPALTDALWPILNIDEAIWEIAGDNVFGNLDSYYTNANNFFVVHDAYHDQMELVNHDLNLSFGTWDGQGPKLDPFFKFDSKRIPLVKHAFLDDRIRLEYLAHVRTLAERLFDWDGVIKHLVTKHQDLIRAEVLADDKKIFSDQDFTDGLTKEIQGEWFRITALRPHVRVRRNFLLTHPDIQKPRVQFERVEIVPADPRPSDTVTVLAHLSSAVPVEEVELRWRVRGAFQRVSMQDDGQSGDGAAGDGVYAASIPPQPAAELVQYYLVGKPVAIQGLRFEPEFGAHRPFEYRVDASAAVVINEFLAVNGSGLRDEKGEFEDWIELYNRTAQSFDLGGCYLTDELDQPTRWRIPNGTTLPPGWRLLVWCDDEAGDGPYHANFKLTSAGEAVALFDRDGVTQFDGIEFGAQLPDVSTGRLFDADHRWVSLLEPSPAASNQPSCGTRRYSALEVAENPVALKLTGNLKRGGSVQLDVNGGSASAPGVLVASASPDYRDLDPGVVLVRLVPALWFLAPLDANGAFTISATLPDDPAFDGVVMYFQHLSTDGKGPIDYSNAVELRLCK